MSGPKRNPDKLNTIGVVVVGICGAVLVYVTIVALQAFYMNDTSEPQNTADYGNQDAPLKLLRADQQRNITELQKNGGETYRIPIDRAMNAVVESAKVDPSTLVPSAGKADKPTIQPMFGRPVPLAKPADGAGSGAGSGSAAPAPTPAPTDGSGSGAGSGSAAPEAGSASGSASGSAATPAAPPVTPATPVPARGSAAGSNAP